MSKQIPMIDIKTEKNVSFPIISFNERYIHSTEGYVPCSKGFFVWLQRKCYEFLKKHGSPCSYRDVIETVEIRKDDILEAIESQMENIFKRGLVPKVVLMGEDHFHNNFRELIIKMHVTYARNPHGTGYKYKDLDVLVIPGLRQVIVTCYEREQFFNEQL